MPMTLLLLPVAWLIVLVVNIAPAFMPPTWAVLATFHIATPELPLLPLTVGGAAASALGRSRLALLSRTTSRFLPAREARNAVALGALFERHQRLGLLLLFAYCLGPLPSNWLFIGAGLARIRLRVVAVTFFLSRALADTFWVWGAGRASASLATTFERYLTSWQAILLQLAAMATVVLLLRLPWTRWLPIETAETAEVPRTDVRST
ncbi:MAG: hypothetical protein K1X87_07385 [Dehalococcoidia bacterium]|nr:hypothetical protein [Dehalococcoidia bacterium]